MYRLTQLWLQPADGEDISAAFAAAVAAVPSYKWLPLVYQMASRLGGGSEEFQQVRYGTAQRHGPGTRCRYSRVKAVWCMPWSRT